MGLAAACANFDSLIKERSEEARFKALANTYWRVLKEQSVVRGQPNSSANLSRSDQIWQDAAENYNRETEALGREGIRKVNLIGNKIEYIECSDGTAPWPESDSFWSWVWPLTYPFIGFLIPSGAIRILAWIGRGFSQTQN